MTKLTFAPIQKKTLEINGEVFEVQVNEVEIAEMVSEFEKAMQRMGKKWPEKAKKTEVKPGDVDDACESLKIPALGIEKMLGTGALEKIMGTASVPFAKATEIFEKVSTAIFQIYEEDYKKPYE